MQISLRPTRVRPQARALRPKLQFDRLRDALLDLAGFAGLALWTSASLYALSLLP